MIDREGLFSPNATSRGEPDSDKLAYLSLGRWWLVESFFYGGL